MSSGVILILDKQSITILSTYVKMSELMEWGI